MRRQKRGQQVGLMQQPIYHDSQAVQKIDLAPPLKTPKPPKYLQRQNEILALLNIGHPEAI
jgi:hypothetical protein